MNARHRSIGLLFFLGGTILLLWLALPATVAASGAEHATVGSTQEACFAGLEGIKNWLMTQITAAFSYRERMIQMLAVGLAIGLFIMLRKMPGQT